MNMRSTMDEKDYDIQSNKISRLQFLKLLGAGAIGYFAYRAGFINSLFRNATAQAGGWVGAASPPKYVPPTSTGWLS
jgi:hypothetical protein